MTTHTPGPWAIRDFDRSPVGIYAPGCAEPSADLAKVFVTAPHGRKRSPEFLANARIIAAAPVMLDALLAAECAVQELCHGQDPANQCWVTLADIRAAIAAAAPASSAVAPEIPPPSPSVIVTTEGAGREGHTGFVSDVARVLALYFGEGAPPYFLDADGEEVIGRADALDMMTPLREPFNFYDDEGGRYTITAMHKV